MSVRFLWNLTGKSITVLENYPPAPSIKIYFIRHRQMKSGIAFFQLKYPLTFFIPCLEFLFLWYHICFQFAVDHLNDMKRIHDGNRIWKVFACIGDVSIEHIRNKKFHFKTFFFRYWQQVWLHYRILSALFHIDGLPGNEILNDYSISTVLRAYVDFIYTYGLCKRKPFHIHISHKCVYCSSIRNMEFLSDLACCKADISKTVYNHHIDKVCASAVLFKETDFFITWESTVGIGAFPAALFVHEDKFETILKHRVDGFSDIMSFRMHSWAAFFTECRNRLCRYVDILYFFSQVCFDIVYFDKRIFHIKKLCDKIIM